MDWELLGFKGIGQVFNIHPLFVHFPIALFPTSLFFYFLAVVTRRRSLAFLGRWCLCLAFAATILTVITGELGKDTFPHSETIHRMILTHEKIGFSALILGFILSVWTFWSKEAFPKLRFLFLFMLALATLLVLQNGDLGGRMVFIEGAAVKPALEKVKDGQERYHHEHFHPH